MGNKSRDRDKAVHERRTTVTAVQMFGNHFLKVVGIDAENIVRHIPTEIETYDLEKVVIEELYELEDGSLLHLVFQDSTSTENEEYLLRLMKYTLEYVKFMVRNYGQS